VDEAGDAINFSKEWLTMREHAIKKVLNVKKLIPISIIFISKEKMRALHGSYYGAAKVTDVLSFFYEKEVGIEHEYGEIFLCTSFVYQQAKRYSVLFEEELTRLLIHGTLHIYGYDHTKLSERKKMNTVAQLIVQQIKKHD